MKEREFKKLLDKQKKLAQRMGELEAKKIKLRKELNIVEDQIYGACCEAQWPQDYKDRLRKERSE